jgi:poly(3-hydroxybutyrate) depolymerase
MMMPNMLYHAYELQRQFAEPMRLWANAVERASSHPHNPFNDTWWGKSVAAGAEIMSRLTRSYGKPVFGLPTTEVDGKTVAVNEEILLRKPFCQLIHFHRDTPRRDPKVLLVAPMSGHYATLLRGTVEALLPEHDVYVTDWIDARTVPLANGNFDLDDYIDYIIEFCRYLAPDVHVIAVCQPSVPVMGAASLMAQARDPRQPRSLTLMGGPIDTRISPTVPNDLAMRNSMMWFRQNVISTVPLTYPGAMRRVYPGFLQLTSFITMNFDRHVNAHMRQFEHLIKGDDDPAELHRKFYDEYLAVMDLTAEFYLQTIQIVFKEHQLPRGVWVSRGRPIEPPRIETALMTVEGELDDISGLGQTKAAHTLTPGIPGARHVHWEQPRVGHYGIFNGRKWREQILPRVRDFIRANDG